MARVCEVCSHKKRSSIEAAVVRGEVKSRIAIKYGITNSSIYRHSRVCLSAQLVAAASQRNIDVSGDVLEQMREVQVTAIQRMRHNVEREDDAPAVAWARIAQSGVETLARVSELMNARIEGGIEIRWEE